MPHVTALVTATEEPLENLNTRYDNNLARTQILVTDPPGPLVGYRGLPLDPEHWLTVGQTVSVAIDPSNPNGYEIDWTTVPSMADRVAAGEQSLVDPMGARLRVWDALAAAGFHEPDLDQVAPQALQVEMTSMRNSLAAEPDAFARQLAALGTDAPSGYQRALVQIVTTTAHWEAHDRQDVEHREVLGKHSVVLSVSIPGSAPYAVLLERFDHKSRTYAESAPGLPAEVSLSDPTDVRVLWDEMAKPGQAVGAMPLQPTAPASGPGSAFPPAMLATMTASANAMVAQLPPAARPATIAYYKSMGIEVDPALSAG